MRTIIHSRLPIGFLAVALSLVGLLRAQDADKRIVLSLTLPGGSHVKVTQTDGTMASVTMETLSVGLTPVVKGDLVAVTIHQLDADGNPADKPIATVTGEIGQSLTLQLASSEEPLQIVPERVY